MQELLEILNIEHYTSPYEADSQMAYMVKEGLADFAISEDADLIAFGCPKLFLKISSYGTGEVFDYWKFKEEKDPKVVASWSENLKIAQKMNWD